MADQGSLVAASNSIPQPAEANELSSEEILRRLVSWAPSLAERRRLIIEAEILDFEPHQLERLATALFSFIDGYRESNDPADLVAVGAAIRKCVATLKADEVLPYAARLLEAGPRAPLPLEVELELVEMVARKLTANPPEHDDPLPDLGDRLFDIADTYLSPRLLAREKYAAIALNAILSLVLLRSPHVAEVSRRISGLNVPWFRHSLARRVGRLRQELGERSSGALPEGLDRSLAEVEAQAV